MISCSLRWLSGSECSCRAPCRDRYRGPVQGALVAGGIVALTALPYVLGFGRSSSNPSALPNNYAAALGILLVLIAAVAAVLVALRRNR